MDDPQNQPPRPSEESTASVASSPSVEPELAAKAEEYLAGWKRAQADYQNLKKEVERDRAEYAKYANERLLEKLLPAIDQFALALKFLPDLSALSEAQRKPMENWLVGIRAVQSLWDQLASSIGLERIPTDGAFDPIVHEAAGEEVVEGKESGTIIRVVQDGWRLHGKVLRPARVIIAK
jgi:molecular chaperone GrpE